MTVQEVITLIDKAIEKNEVNMAQLRDKTYTGFELTTHAEDTMQLSDSCGACRALRQLKLDILLYEEE